MKITSRATFAGDPATVFGLLTDEKFLEAVAVKGQSLSYAVSSDGSTTSTTQELASPSGVSSFVGSTLTVVQKIAWGEAAADGTRTGQVSLTVPKQPVAVNGTVVLRPDGSGSVVDLDGELKVNIPLLGKKLEQASEPAILAGFQHQEEVAKEWLAR